MIIAIYLFLLDFLCMYHQHVSRISTELESCSVASNFSDHLPISFFLFFPVASLLELTTFLLQSKLCCSLQVCWIAVVPMLSFTLILGISFASLLFLDLMSLSFLVFLRVLMEHLLKLFLKKRSTKEVKFLRLCDSLARYAIHIEMLFHQI